MYKPSHDELQKRLKRRLIDYVRYAWDYGELDYSDGGLDRYSVGKYVTTEVMHRHDDLPSGKEYCRTDIEIKLPSRTLAFEMKASKNDAVNWFTQRRDYQKIGIETAIVVPMTLAYELVPHQSSVLSGPYVIYDDSTREDGWIWQHSISPPMIDEVFTTTRPIEFADECPECGCWTRCSSGTVVECVNCHWRATTDEIEKSDSLIDACWKCGV